MNKSFKKKWQKNAMNIANGHWSYNVEYVRAIRKILNQKQDVELDEENFVWLVDMLEATTSLNSVKSFYATCLALKQKRYDEYRPHFNGKFGHLIAASNRSDVRNLLVDLEIFKIEKSYKEAIIALAAGNLLGDVGKKDANILKNGVSIGHSFLSISVSPEDDIRHAEWAEKVKDLMDRLDIKGSKKIIAKSMCYASTIRDDMCNFYESFFNKSDMDRMWISGWVTWLDVFKIDAACTEFRNSIDVDNESIRSVLRVMEKECLCLDIKVKTEKSVESL